MPEDRKQVIITGNPVEGFQFIGPFVSFDAAVDCANGLTMDCWHIAPLTDPTSLEVMIKVEVEQ